MVVPTPIPLSAVPNGGVITGDLTEYFINSGGGTMVDLATGQVANNIPLDAKYYYFANASLVLS